jgi:hypothetical protein
MLWLTLRELTRILRSKASGSDGKATVSATAL